jgi:hypothetical protein
MSFALAHGPTWRVQPMTPRADTIDYVNSGDSSTMPGRTPPGIQSHSRPVNRFRRRWDCMQRIYGLAGAEARAAATATVRASLGSRPNRLARSGLVPVRKPCLTLVWMDISMAG